ncbi:MAG TPA: hypothetical protein PK307_11975, partial [Spirochaetota bacterium]|nr:hypothetical protein [Spirochaetota bacterium]
MRRIFVIVCCPMLMFPAACTKLASSDIASLLSLTGSIGNRTVFGASDGTNGTEIWVSDGTESGTHMLKNINPGAADSFPFYFAALESLVLFNANDGTNGNELWVTDGTEVGTQMLMNIATGSNSSSPQGLVAMAGMVFFQARDTTNGIEPWISDGTSGGTFMIENIRTGDSWPSQFTRNAGGLVYFTATDDTHGQELFYTNLTGDYALLWKDIYANVGSSNPGYLFTIGNTLYF